MAFDAGEIRGWLLRQPRPATLRVVTEDDRHHEVNVTGSVSWAAIAKSIHALDPALIEAYDDKGKLIRAVKPQDDDDDEDGEKREASPLVIPQGTDPQSIMLIHFADLLASAYRHSTDVAFERLTSLFEAVNRRSESLERSLESTHRLLRKVVQEQVEAAPEDEKKDLITEMVEGFAAAAAQNGAANGAPTNGKAG